jgi:hypothetical protein
MLELYSHSALSRLHSKDLNSDLSPRYRKAVGIHEMNKLWEEDTQNLAGSGVSASEATRWPLPKDTVEPPIWRAVQYVIDPSD